MRFSREFERQADIEGSHLMARAGYDPRDMASMFKLIAQRSGPGGPEWLSDHPNPGNRYEYISQEAGMLHLTRPVHDTGAFRPPLPRYPELEEPGVLTVLVYTWPCNYFNNLDNGPDEVHRWRVGRNVIKAFREHGTTASAAGGDLI